MSLVGRWHFTSLDGHRDLRGGFAELELHGFAGLTHRGLELGHGSWARAAYRQGPTLTEKTVVCWVRMRRTGNPRGGGSVMSVAVESPDHEPFDGLAFGDTGDHAWLAASSWNDRTHPDLASAGDEDEARSWGRLVKMAVTWRDVGGGRCEVSIYRQPLLSRQRRGPLELLQRFEHGTLVDFQAGAAEVLFGPRFFSEGQPVGHVTCTVAAAMVWDEVLDEQKLAHLTVPLARTVPDAQGVEVVEAAETFALIIGVQDYAFLDDSTGAGLGRSNLRGTLEDVRSNAMLTRLMGVPASHIRVLTGPKLGPNDFASIVMGRESPVDMNMVDASFGHATEAGIRRGLAWLAACLRTHPGSQGLLFFAGHSITTTKGHLALVPMDARQGAGTVDPWPQDVAEDGAIARWQRAAGLLRRLAGVLDTTHPDRVLDAFRACFGDDGQVTPASLAAAVQAHGADLALPATRTLLRDLVEQAEAPQLSTVFEAVRAADLDAHAVHAALHTDPFARDDELHGLVSFVEAFGSALLPLPSDRALTVVLETCLPEADGRRIGSWYHDHGLPTVHDQMPILSSCGLGQSSYSGVFDNRWHGAFTWALTSLLSQQDVVVSNAGRYFRKDYGKLLALVHRLLGIMGFGEQDPRIWGQGEDWPVFGRGEWEEQLHEVGLIPRVKVKEEVEGGTSGGIYEAEALSNGASLGFLVVTVGSPLTVTLGGSSTVFPANTETWTAGVPQAGFKLRRPSTTPSGGTSLAHWVEANLSAPPGQGKVVFSSQSFASGSGGSSSSFGAHYEVWHKAGPPDPPNPTLLALVRVPSGTTLHWYRKGSLTSSSRLAFTQDGSAVVQKAGEEVRFEYQATAPPTVSWLSPILTDTAV